MNRSKRMISGVMSVLMTLSLFGNIPVYSLAAEDTGLPEVEEVSASSLEIIPEPVEEYTLEAAALSVSEPETPAEELAETSGSSAMPTTCSSTAT